MKYTRIFAGLICIFLLSSCFEDNGNYDYKDIEVNEIYIRYPVYSATFYEGDPVVFEPTITYYNEEQKEKGDTNIYKWSYHFDDLGCVCTERNMNMVVEEAELGKTYNGIVMAEDTVTGAIYSQNISFSIQSRYKVGWVILSDDAGSSKLNVVRNQNEVWYTDKDIYQKMYNTSLGTEPVKLIGNRGGRAEVRVLQNGTGGNVILSGDGIYKLDYNKVLEYHIAKRADITVVCTDVAQDEATRFGCVKMNEDCRIEEFDEKPMVTQSTTISTGIYVIRRRQLIELIEKCGQEDRHDFVKDILIRYKNLKRIYGYKINDYWSNISTVESYYKTNMDFLKPEIRDYFFRQYPGIQSKIDDLPPAKYNPGADVRNSLISSGCIINGQVENSILFKKVFVGNNCVIKNSIILNDVYLGDNTHIENCVVESRDTIRANSYYCGEDGIKVVIEKNERYVL